MSTYSLDHVSDGDLLRGLAAIVAQDRAITAAMLAHIAEVDARRLYVPAAFPSMFAYCVHELHLSEDTAYKRIRAARLARQFPVIFSAVADGRLHLGALTLLAPYLTPENADDLLAASEHKPKSEIEELLAERFARPELLARVEAFPQAAMGPGPVEARIELAPGRVEAGTDLAPGRVGTYAGLAPIAPERFHLELTIGRSTRDKLRYAQELLGHQLPSGDAAEVLDRALDALIETLEKRKFAAAPRSRQSQRPSRDPRHVPAQVKRAVWERDGGQCTFVSETGRRCAARKLLEFDHIEEVARGGRASVAGIRLRCRAHNQYTAECAFGAGFMSEKREAARRRSEARRQQTEVRARAAAAESSPERDVVPWLRRLGFRADEAKRAAERCQTIPDAPLEQRVRLALSVLSSPP